MSGKMYLAISILAIITAISIIANLTCPKTMNNLFRKTEIPEVEILRFQRVETFVFTKTKYETRTAVIYEDTKTGIKYLYIWKGAYNGGPCITRLWEK